MLTDGNKDLIQTGVQYPAGGPVTTPASFVNAIAGGKTADVISATIAPGSVGLFQVLLHLNPDLPTDPYSQLTIAQDIYVSNIVTLPIASDGGAAATALNATGSGASGCRRRDIVHYRASARQRFERVCERRQSVRAATRSRRAVSLRCTAPISLRRLAIPGFRVFDAALHAGRRDDDDGRRFRALVLRLTDSVQFSSSAVYAHGPGIDHADGHSGSVEDQLHGAAEALCAGAVYHQPGRHGTGFHVDRRHGFAGGAQRRIPGLASGEDRRIHLDLRNGSRRRVEPARSRRRSVPSTRWPTR